MRTSILAFSIFLASSAYAGEELKVGVMTSREF